MDVVAPEHRSILDRWFGTRHALAVWSVVMLVTNCVLIVTGAFVRLTASGLGCDTWPRCNNDSYVAHGEAGYHSYVEFGNRLLTFVLIAIAIATLVSAIRTHASRRVRTWCWAILLGLPMQGVVGGIVVLSHLNPWLVALHLLLSIMLIVWNVDLVQLTGARERVQLPDRERLVTRVLFWVLMLAIWVGTVVTGAGPHAGDLRAHRNNMDILWVARVHAEIVWLAIALTAWLIWRFMKLGLHRPQLWANILMGTMLLQGAIGYLQYFNGLPVWLVLCHMTGLCLVTVAVSWLHYGTHRPA